MASGGACNLVIADLKGFGAWEYAWHVPEYSARDLKYSNMFHCSALFHKSLWQAVPRGYPIETLFGYEDWAFWIFAEEMLEGGIRPCYIHEELFRYRIRPDSMHQSLLKNQEYSIASLRMLHPNLFPSELIVSAHDKFLGINSEVWAAGTKEVRAKVPVKVFSTVDDKINKFPWSGPLRTIRGLLLEGTGDLEAAMEETSWPSPVGPQDWQPQWGRPRATEVGTPRPGNATLSALHRDFDGSPPVPKPGQPQRAEGARGPYTSGRRGRRSRREGRAVKHVFVSISTRRKKIYSVEPGRTLTRSRPALVVVVVDGDDGDDDGVLVVVVAGPPGGLRPRSPPRASARSQSTCGGSTATAFVSASFHGLLGLGLRVDRVRVLLDLPRVPRLDKVLGV